MDIVQIYFPDFDLMNKERYKDLKDQVRILEELATGLSLLLDDFAEKTKNK